MPAPVLRTAKDLKGPLDHRVDQVSGAQEGSVENLAQWDQKGLVVMLAPLDPRDLPALKVPAGILFRDLRVPLERRGKRVALVLKVHRVFLGQVGPQDEMVRKARGDCLAKMDLKDKLVHQGQLEPQECQEPQVRLDPQDTWVNRDPLVPLVQRETRVKEVICKPRLWSVPSLDKSVNS